MPEGDVGRGEGGFLLSLRLKEVFSVWAKIGWIISCGVECSETARVHVVKLFQAFIPKCLLVLLGV